MNESTFNQLYKSTVNAFPHTQKRQHAINPITIEQIRFTPFVGLKTLFVTSEAHNADRVYKPIIVFKNVKYGNGNVLIQDNIGKHYMVEKLSLDHDVLIRCGCMDFYWRFHHFDHLDKSLQGPNRKKYEAIYAPGSANPTESPGFCKHLIKFFKILEEQKVV